MSKLSDITKLQLDSYLSVYTYQGESDCILWSGVDINGYAVICKNGNYRVTRLIGFYYLNMPDNPNIFVLHKCDNPSCVRIDHLFIGNHSDNKQDEISKGRNFESKKTNCPKGHPYSGSNLRQYGTHRKCHICKLEATRKWNRKTRNRRSIK